MAVVTLEVPDNLTKELAQHGISDDQIRLLVIEVMELWLQTGKEHLSTKLVDQWLEILEEREDVQDVEETEQLLREDPSAFMSLEECNAVWDS